MMAAGVCVSLPVFQLSCALSSVGTQQRQIVDHSHLLTETLNPAATLQDKTLVPT
jgi:hypothetical protein